MKFRKTKRGIAAVLTIAMGLGLCGCKGDTSVGNNGEAQRYFKATYLENLPDTFNEYMSGNTIFKGDSFYYSSYNEDYTKNGVYSFNLITGETQTIWEGESNPDSELQESVYADSYTVDDDGNFYMYITHNSVDPASLEKDYSGSDFDDVIEYMTSEWGYDEEMAKEDWESYYAESYTDEDGNVDYGKFLQENNREWINTYMIRKLDKDGNVVYEYDIAAETEENSYSSCSDIAVDKDGYLYAFMNEWDDESDIYYMIVLDKDGNEKGRIDYDGYANGIFTMGDGRVAASGWGDAGVELSIFDGQNLKIVETIQADELYNPTVLDETHLLYSDGTALYSYNLEDESKEKYLSWMDCNISSAAVQSFGVLSDGSIGVYTQTWSDSDGRTICDLVILNEVDESEAANVATINIACLWSDSTIEEKAIEFNKKHDDYRITITPYYTDGMEYEDAIDSFTTAIASDTSVDIVIFNDYSQVVNFASKGLLIDMYDLIDNDDTLKREDFLQNVLGACEIDGKLVMLPTTFSVLTVVGKTEDVGTESGWTFDEMQALLASKPEGTELFYGMTRDQAFSMCLSLGYNDYIDWENGSCNFDSEEFINILEFANMFPEEFEWSEEVDETVLLNTGKVLLSTYYLADFEQIQMYREIYAGDLTYIGYPTTEGNGAMLELQNMLGITKNCESKEVAWEFLREFYMPTEDSEDTYYYGFSVRQDEFDKFCEEAMKEDEYGGGTWGWGSFEVEIKPATQEDVDTVKELVAGTTAISGAVSSDILNIIEEEAAAYFAGEKSAEDVASIIQSRMEIYLNETK